MNWQFLSHCHWPHTTKSAILRSISSSYQWQVVSRSTIAHTPWMKAKSTRPSNSKTIERIIRALCWTQVFKQDSAHGFMIAGVPLRCWKSNIESLFPRSLVILSEVKRTRINLLPASRSHQRKSCASLHTWFWNPHSFSFRASHRTVWSSP